MKPRWSFAVSLLLLSTLACSALNQTLGASTATSAPTQTLRVSALTPTPAPTQTLRVSGVTPTPLPTQTLRVSSVTPSPAAPSLPFTLDNAADAQAAMLPQFAADARTLPDASRYVIELTITFADAR